jgi:hypothetical protein
VKYVYIPAEATTDGREYAGFADDETADALAAAYPAIDVAGDPGQQ